MASPAMPLALAPAPRCWAPADRTAARPARRPLADQRQVASATRLAGRVGVRLCHYARMACLFCGSSGPFSTVEHVIPESLGNDDLMLEGQVCDGCQRYFGKEVEHYVLNKSPIGLWRVLLGTRTKKGKRPKADLSQPSAQKGVLRCVSSHHDDVAFEALQDESLELTKISSDLAEQIERGERSQFRFVFTPYALYMLGRFLCKVGLELVCVADPEEARTPRYDVARKYARFGPWKPLWPILWYQAGSIDQLKVWKRDEQGWSVESQCYTYWLADVREHRVFEFGIGTDRFTIALDEPLCCMLLEAENADPQCKVLWYPAESLAESPSASR